MDQQSWKKIENILDEALTLDKAEKRKTFVYKRCKNDKTLYQKTIRLLNCIRKADEENFLEVD